MLYAPFHQLFPKIAMEKTRNVILYNHEHLPDGTYAILPSYCTDKKCDCRRAFMVIHKIEDDGMRSPPLATISYGWEELSFYRAWSSFMSDDLLKDYKGPSLDKYQAQSEYAEHLLELFKKEALKDADYVERIKRYYAYFKQKQGMKLPPDLRRLANTTAPCPCGSGRILRRCCLKQRSLSKRRGRR